MTVSILVTSYGRRFYLERCLRSLLSQTRLPDEVVVVTRKGDEETRRYVVDFLSSHPGPVRVQHAEVDRPGVLEANRAGFTLATGDLLCFIDDDAAARPDWVARIERHFAESPDVGAVGGRDIQHTAGGVDDRPTKEVGRIRWYGRILGYHHMRVAGVHPAEALKGCNMAFRRALVRGFDEGIIGDAHHYELDLCFGVRHAGYRILYDGDLVVDHYVDAPRYLPANADPRDPGRFYFMHHNTVYVMMKNLSPSRRALFFVYTFLSDALASPIRWAAGKPEGRLEVIRESFRGKWDGLKRYRSRGRGPAAPNAGTIP